MTVYLDTHVAAFVHAGDPALLSGTATQMLESASSTRVSPMVVLELQHLFEVDKLAVSGAEIAGFLRDHLGIAVDSDGLGQAVLHAVALTWTRDPDGNPHRHAFRSPRSECPQCETPTVFPPEDVPRR